MLNLVRNYDNDRIFHDAAQISAIPKKMRMTLMELSVVSVRDQTQHQTSSHLCGLTPRSQLSGVAASVGWEGVVGCVVCSP